MTGTFFASSLLPRSPFSSPRRHSSRWPQLLLAGAIALGLAPTLTHAASQPQLEVIHGWTAASETTAVKVLADALHQRGVSWVDTPVALTENAAALAIGRFSAGDPAAISQLTFVRSYFELAETGRVADFDRLAAQENWRGIIPQIYLDQITFDGHIRGIPVNANLQNYLWASKAAFAKAGVAVPTRYDQLFPALDALKRAGVIPLAHGGQPWQDDALFSAILAGKGGAALYNRVYRDRDPQAIHSAEFRAVAEDFKRLHQYVDPASPGRNWNDTTALVISGKAGVQILGEWVRGEFTRAGQVYGKDFESHVGPGSEAIIGGDVFVAAKTDDAALRHSQELFAQTVLDKEVQVRFANAKGSLPIRTDIDAGQLEPAAQEGLKFLREGNHLLLHPQTLNSSDITGPAIDAITRFWNTPDETVDDFVDEFASALAN